MDTNRQTIARVSKANKDGNLRIWIPINETKNFKPGDHVVIIKVPSLEFKKASEMIHDV